MRKEEHKMSQQQRELVIWNSSEKLIEHPNYEYSIRDTVGGLLLKQESELGWILSLKWP